MIVMPSEMDPRHQQLRALLIQARQEKKLSQAVLGERLGKTQVWVSNYERGGRGLDVIEFLDVTHAIGVDPHKLLRRLN